MTADGLLNTYSYDAENRVKAIGGSNVAASYVYDAFGHRVEQAISSVANDYIFGLDGHILHYNVSGQVGLGEDVYADGRHIALYSGGTVYMSHADQVGSIRKWTIYNSGGYWTSQGTFSNLPFGDAQTTNSGAGVADHDFFSGFIQDPDGEFASPTRRYSAIQSRWQVPDPAGLAAVDPSNPQTWNRYAYVTNNPLSFTDPTGLKLCDGCHFMGWGGGANCSTNMDGVSTPCEVVNATMQGGGISAATWCSGGFCGQIRQDESGQWQQLIGWQFRTQLNLDGTTQDTLAPVWGDYDAEIWAQAFPPGTIGPTKVSIVTTLQKPPLKPNVLPSWGSCSYYRDGSGGGSALYQICMNTPNSPWGNCVRGTLLNQYTPNPNPPELFVYLFVDHPIDFASCLGK